MYISSKYLDSIRCLSFYVFSGVVYNDVTVLEGGGGVGFCVKLTLGMMVGPF